MTEDIVEEVAAPTPSKETHPIATKGTMDHFDGEKFIIDGKEYPLDKIKVDILRAFGRRNDIKTSNRPYKSLRREKKPGILEAIKAKKDRINKKQQDPWVTDKSSVDDDDDDIPKKKASINKFRMANVVYHETLKEHLLERGKCLDKDQLDLKETVDQKLFEKIAEEYNKTGDDEECDYDMVAYPYINIDKSNLPHKFVAITWQDAKRVFKECLQELDKFRKNQELSGTNDSDAEEDLEHEGLKIVPFTTKKYIHYWNCFAEDNPGIFMVMNAELPDDIFLESKANKNDSKSHRRSKKKRKADYDLVEAFNASTKVDKKRLEVDEKKTAALAAGIKENTLSKLRNDKMALKKQNMEFQKELIDAIGDRKEAKRRLQLHEQRLELKERQDTGDVLTQDSLGSADSQALLMNTIIDGKNDIKKIEEKMKRIEGSDGNGNGNGEK